MLEDDMLHYTPPRRLRLAGIVAAVLFTHDFPVLGAVAIALLVGLLGGVLNGVLVSLIGILPFIATLATLTVFSGAAFLITSGDQP